MLIAYKGFSIGYTISAIISTLGIQKGVVFSIASLLLQNLIFIPSLFILAISGINLFKKIKHDKYVNIKIEFYKHVIIMLIVSILSMLSSFVEIYVSTNFLILLKNFF